MRFDGPVSVKAAWTIAELKEMAERAGLRGEGGEAVSISDDVDVVWG